ncbi:MAG: TrmH family RNA methyltransferase [Anaerovoracaceae bacterium]|jgi:TrmH family RNA methyltransferase|nr:RNA methyltransferase [Clostridiales bacterium]
MKLITSSDNQTYKKAARLKQKKYRDEQNQYLIEGPNLVHEAYKCNIKIEMVLISEDYRDSGIFPNVQTVKVTSGLFRKLSDTESPQGILAIVNKRAYTEAEFFAQKTASSNLIVLDRLQDPGNIGTILRTADAAGFNGAILIKGTADIFSPKIVRATAGSLFRLPVFMVESPKQAIILLKKYGKKIICTAPNCCNNYNDVDMQNDVAVIIGNEGNGVSDEFLIKSDYLVKIPMQGTIESLNAAVSAGILMYESVRQRYQHGCLERDNS